MKIFKTLLSVATVAALSLIGATEAYAGSWVDVEMGTVPNQVDCSLRIGDTLYPGNGNFIYCGDPALRSTNGAAALQAVNSQPTPVLNALNAVPVKVYIFKDWATYKKAFNLTVLPSNISPTAHAGDSDIDGPTIRSTAVQFIDAVGGSPGSVPVYSRINGIIVHELAHQLDTRMVKPTGVTVHSQNTSGTALTWYNALQKDIIFINGQTKCTQIFQTDKVLVGGVLTNICNSSGNLIAPYAGKTNWDILKLLYPTVFNSPDITNGIATNSEFWSEQYSAIAVGGTEALFLGKSYDFYLKNQTYFSCTNTYIRTLKQFNILAVTGTYILRCQ
ncbi:MAG: hypothetical protein WCT03_10245 [Candidatus Obscuribacterales bacterium]|jgi:hypothetical protein